MNEKSELRKILENHELDTLDKIEVLIRQWAKSKIPKELTWKESCNKSLYVDSDGVAGFNECRCQILKSLDYDKSMPDYVEETSKSLLESISTEDTPNIKTFCQNKLNEAIKDFKRDFGSKKIFAGYELPTLKVSRAMFNKVLTEASNNVKLFSVDPMQSGGREGLFVYIEPTLDPDRFDTEIRDTINQIFEFAFGNNVFKTTLNYDTTIKIMHRLAIERLKRLYNGEKDK